MERPASAASSAYAIGRRANSPSTSWSAQSSRTSPMGGCRSTPRSDGRLSAGALVRSSTWRHRAGRSDSRSLVFGRAVPGRWPGRLREDRRGVLPVPARASHAGASQHAVGVASATPASQLLPRLQRLRESREHALRRLRIEHAPASHGARGLRTPLPRARPGSRMWTRLLTRCSGRSGAASMPAIS